MADHLHSLISSLPPEDQAEVAGHMAASTGMDHREAQYMAALPGRMAGHHRRPLSAFLPDGLRFEVGASRCLRRQSVTTYTVEFDCPAHGRRRR